MSANHDLDDYHWLVGSQASGYLEKVEQSDWPLHRLVASLRRDLSATRTHLIIDQTTLRRRAAAKFSRPDQMFFTAVGLEQATDQWLAHYKAQRFPGGPVADLCCGLGGDLIALAGRGVARGVDRDPVSALLAEVNCRSVGHPSRVVVCDAESFALADFEAWHIDPDRRASGRRTRSLDEATPSLATIRQRLQDHPNGAIKLSAAMDLPRDWSDQVELEWISRQRHCRQLVVWFGDLATEAGHRRATLFGNDTRPIRTVIGAPGERLPVTRNVGPYLIEPDSAVLAANLAETLAVELGLTTALPGGVFFTSDHPIDDCAVSTFEVIEAMPYHPKRVRQLLRSRGIGGLEIKTRGVDHQPEQLRKELAAHGPVEATLFVIRVDRSVLAILSRRLP